MAASRTSLNIGWERSQPDFPEGGVSRHQRSALPRSVGATEEGFPDAGRGEGGRGVAAGLGVSGGGRLVARIVASGRGGGGGGEAVAIKQYRDAPLESDGASTSNACKARRRSISITPEISDDIVRAVRAMSESMRQNRLSRGQNDGSLGSSNDSQKHEGN
ncbi:hypothetical protein C2845_PM12G07930 [Panicum miliaceum]|uniref:Uncharacterized protein n=1 Tax=Panicum miliaceum TaxID=4540 RepID=A0A3L6QHV0_PANMI|nr:hypothetical protein C2845_PM12G07930 [Panicum miliaceum]